MVSQMNWAILSLQAQQYCMIGKKFSVGHNFADCLSQTVPSVYSTLFIVGKHRQEASARANNIVSVHAY